ncbi:MAG1450 family lipoprotein [Mycoplasmopsis agalactiae]|uniref:Uncharacterized protein n=1 Tax=Mycoplasmopsis agalactiae (strain NCTC 10123 / CIP 59.7 / PG2) TaxID=347257 RepID=A5IXT4_MYCAP|nr:hypothetical protein [Mycoplasmopsis agalactiae]MCE6114365.1 hypothetical protein [Mycoplasmopsis agalactiae]QYR08414.1 hypothetical protein E5287_00725 [Mycoplasmopsis agalactiae]CAL58843.1 Conserved hypothetical protein, predictedlipoprotein [Mycoplasmopsis agalactiae PG2]
MKKFKFMAFAIVAFIPPIPLIMAGCNNKSNNNSHNDGKNPKENKLDSVIKITDLGELAKKDIENIKSALIAKNSELNLTELSIEISEKENKAVIKAKDKNASYSGEVVVTFSVKNSKNEETTTDAKTKLQFETKVKEVSSNITKAHESVKSTVTGTDANSKVDNDKFKNAFPAAQKIMTESKKEIDKLEKDLNSFDTKVKQELSGSLSKVKNQFDAAKLEIDSIAEKHEQQNNPVTAQEAWDALRALWPRVKLVVINVPTFKEVIEHIKKHDEFKKYAHLISLSSKSKPDDRPSVTKPIYIDVKDNSQTIRFSGSFA